MVIKGISELNFVSRRFLQRLAHVWVMDGSYNRDCVFLKLMQFIYLQCINTVGYRKKRPTTGLL